MGVGRISATVPGFNGFGGFALPLTLHPFQATQLLAGGLGFGKILWEILVVFDGKTLFWVLLKSCCVIEPVWAGIKIQIALGFELSRGIEDSILTRPSVNGKELSEG